jgi:hypothetical protein
MGMRRNISGFPLGSIAPAPESRVVDSAEGDDKISRMSRAFSDRLMRYQPQGVGQGIDHAV